MADLDHLLEKTSRTFALSIPLLPVPLRREVTIAYLLFRIADTFEDSASWPPEDRIDALIRFDELLGRPNPESVRQLAAIWSDRSPIEHDGYQELLVESPFVLQEFSRLRERARQVIHSHVSRTIAGMAYFVSRTDVRGSLNLVDLSDLRRYCYTVAGIVGEMLTELFLLNASEQLKAESDTLRQRAAEFGEALQLVNILKDSSFDQVEGRSYLSGVNRAEIFALARKDLQRAAEYVAALERGGSSEGLIAFNALPMQLAWATLDRVEKEGPGSKLTRPEVFEIIERMNADLTAGQSVAAHRPRC